MIAFTVMSHGQTFALEGRFSRLTLGDAQKRKISAEEREQRSLRQVSIRGNSGSKRNTLRVGD